MAGAAGDAKRVPAGAKAKAGAAAGAGGADDFEEFPGALQDEDDDLPF